MIPPKRRKPQPRRVGGSDEAGTAHFYLFHSIFFTSVDPSRSSAFIGGFVWTLFHRLRTTARGIERSSRSISAACRADLIQRRRRLLLQHYVILA
jgi:hypothetical protein